jgi:hypothetical protein
MVTSQYPVPAGHLSTDGHSTRIVVKQRLLPERPRELETQGNKTSGRGNERKATQWQSTHPGVKIQPEAKGDTVPEEGEGNWGAEVRRGRDRRGEERRGEEKRANFRIKISADSSADLVVVDKAGSQSIADIASMLRKSLS